MMLGESKYLVLGAAVAAVALLLLVKKNGAAAAVGQEVGQAAAELAGGVATGAVLGTGDVIGVPRTNMTECEKAMAEGRTWDASFACPAGDFIGYINPFKNW
jgi:hypothetical protein